ncbi:hypothetical protein B0H19DRAFT_1265326 [Mycena capillaripes]|nr:hypothetical protein B0H19DRAFT_1265326 [Mycena capillaripes]
MQLVPLQPPVTFVPIAPRVFNRYRHRIYTQQVVVDYVVQPLSRRLQLYIPPTKDQHNGSNLQRVNGSLTQWIPHQHPEGALYFRHIADNVFVDADLYDPVVLARLTICLDQFMLRAGAKTVLESNTVDLVLDILKHDEAHFECGYYLVDHAERVVFWLDPFHMTKLRSWRLVPGINTATHVKLGLEMEYWRHWDLFPSAVSVSAFVIKELRDLTVFSILDTMTSPTTTVALPTDYLLRMLSVIDNLVIDEDVVGIQAESTQSLAVIDKASASVIGRFMEHFARERFYNFNGEQFARLDRRNSVYDAKSKASYLFMLVSLFLFNSPTTHLNNINTMFMDGFINSASWNKFVRKLRSDWQETVLFGTLILNANIGFLAISSGTVHLEPLAQISSCISVFFGLASIMIGLLLSRQYGQEPEDAVARDATDFFERRSIIGLEWLAIVYSSPYAFMIWGMFTFLLAFVSMAVQSMTSALRLVVMVGFSAIALATFSCIAAEQLVRYSRILIPRQYL